MGTIYFQLLIDSNQFKILNIYSSINYDRIFHVIYYYY